jgi:hypothetical protein
VFLSQNKPNSKNSWDFVLPQTDGLWLSPILG